LEADDSTVGVDAVPGVAGFGFPLSVGEVGGRARSERGCVLVATGVEAGFEAVVSLFL
jgi:hypothetical protein